MLSNASNVYRNRPQRFILRWHLKRDWRAKKCFSIKTTRRPTNRPLQWQNYELLWIDSSSTLFSGFGPVWLLFPNLKTWLGRKKFSSNEEVIVTVNEYFADFETVYFKWLPNVNYASFLAEIWPFEEWIFRDVASSNGL